MADQGWPDDIELKDDLHKYVQQNLQHKEILDFVKEKYPLYAWSLRTLCRRLKHFEISYINYDTDLDHVEEAVRKEMDGPGSLLGYRALHRKLQEVHTLKVPRNLVYAMMEEVDPSGLEERGGVGKTKRPIRAKRFVSKVYKILFITYFLIFK